MTPARTTVVGGRSVRFYLSPLDGLDFPWVNLADVAELVFPSAEDRAIGMERWAATYPDLTRRAEDGSMIVPDFCPRGLFQWCGECGIESAWALARAYDEAAVEVMTSLYGSLSPSIFSDFVRKAALRNSPVEMVHHAN